MASLIRSQSPAENVEATAEDIAKETATDVELVQKIYKEELTTLATEAKITQYLSVIASRRVRLMLRKH
jgi:hypothetical protein